MSKLKCLKEVPKLASELYLLYSSNFYEGEDNNPNEVDNRDHLYCDY